MLSVGDIVKKSQPSLFWCMRGLEKSKREAIYTLFAFCRHISNIIRSPMPAAEKTELLNAWREELDNIYEKKVPTTNIGRKIYKNCMRFNLPKEQMEKILDSAFLDAPTPLQAPSQEIFEQYLYGLAIVPLNLTLTIIGESKPATSQKLAASLGRALMITYILRDIKDDAKAGHLFIPQELLKKANVCKNSPVSVLEDKNLSGAREALSKDAQKNFATAQRFLSKMNKKSVMPLFYLANLSRCYFEQMNSRGWEIISPKPRISKLNKLKLIVKTLFA